MDYTIIKTSKKINLAQKVDSLQKECDEQSELIKHYQTIINGNLHKNSFTKPDHIDYMNSFIFPSYLDDETPLWFITLSHDPKFLNFCNVTQAVNYYSELLSDAIVEVRQNGVDDIKLFGSYELNKHGNVHAHLIYQSYRGPYEFCDYLKPKLTHRVYLNVAIDIKQVSNKVVNKETGKAGLHGTVDYIIKSPIKLYYRK